MKYYLFALFVSLGTCSSPVKESREAKIVKELSYKELLFTNNLLADTQNYNKSTRDVFQQKTLKIVTIVNYDCGPCRESIKKWKEYLNGKNITFILIVRGGDKEFYEDIRAKESLSFKYIFYDVGNKFELTNKIPQDIRIRTFLINRDNKILIIGNPLFNRAISILYDEETLIANTTETHL